MIFMKKKHAQKAENLYLIIGVMQDFMVVDH